MKVGTRNTFISSLEKLFETMLSNMLLSFVTTWVSVYIPKRQFGFHKDIENQQYVNILSDLATMEIDYQHLFL